MEGAKVKTCIGRNAVMSLIMMILISCQSLEVLKEDQKQKTEILKADMVVTIDGKEYVGTGVLPVKDAYKITIFPKEKADRVTIQTCNRDDTYDKPKTGWFKKEYSYVVGLLPIAETNKSCPLKIESLNENIKNSIAIFQIDDRRPHVSLRMLSKCSGKQSFSNAGVSLCQGAENSVQFFEFPEKVWPGDPEPHCATPESSDGKIWSIKLNRGMCTYYFGSRRKHQNGEYMVHMLTTYGYTMTPYQRD